VTGVPTEARWPGSSQLPGAKAVKWKHGTESRLRQKFPAPGMGVLATGNSGVTLSASGFDLLQRMLSLDPAQRITGEEAVNHPWFKETPLPTPLQDMPKFRSRNDKYIK